MSTVIVGSGMGPMIPSMSWAADVRAMAVCKSLLAAYRLMHVQPLGEQLYKAEDWGLTSGPHLGFVVGLLGDWLSTQRRRLPDGFLGSELADQKSYKLSIDLLTTNWASIICADPPLGSRRRFEPIH